MNFFKVHVLADSPDRTIQFGRPFAEGEIWTYPQVFFDDRPLPTQVDFKSYYLNESLRHAILSVRLPALLKHDLLECSIQDAPLPSFTEVANRWPIEATIEFTLQGQLQYSVNLDEMLSTLAPSSWLEGNQTLAYQVMDHGGSYNWGLDDFLSVRPGFEVYYYLQDQDAKVRFIVEIADTERLQDQTFGLRFLLNNEIIFETNEYTHRANTRFTRTAWTKQKPPVHIDHNLAYLGNTGMIPRFDPFLDFPLEEAVRQHDRWQQGGHGAPYQAGVCYPNAGMGGDSPNHGPYPQWETQYLIAMKSSVVGPLMEEILYAQADAAGFWPVHYREGSGGRPVSIKNRPGLSFYHSNWIGVKPEDQINYIGEAGEANAETPGFGLLPWRMSLSHFPTIGPLAYLLSGEPYYAEEGCFYASWAMATTDPSLHPVGGGRGPTMDRGVLNLLQARETGRQLKQLVEITSVLPDTWPEKTLFEDWINDSLAAEEGARHLTGTTFENTSLWTWAKEAKRFAQTEGGTPSDPPPLGHFFTGNNGLANQPDTLEQGVGRATAFEHFILWALRRAVELGYPAKALYNHLGKLYVGMILESGTPAIVDTIRVPVMKADGTYFEDFTSLSAAYTNEIKEGRMLGFFGPACAGMTVYAALGGLDEQAWQWLHNNLVLSMRPALARDPRYAVLPNFPQPSPAEPEPPPEEPIEEPPIEPEPPPEEPPAEPSELKSRLERLRDELNDILEKLT